MKMFSAVALNIITNLETRKTCHGACIDSTVVERYSVGQKFEILLLKNLIVSIACTVLDQDHLTSSGVRGGGGVVLGGRRVVGVRQLQADVVTTVLCSSSCHATDIRYGRDDVFLCAEHKRKTSSKSSSSSCTFDADECHYYFNS